MRILVIGSGAREHALLWKLSQSEERHDLFVTPGNAGMEGLAECLRPAHNEGMDAYADLAEKSGIDLTVVGPEMYLAQGIVDVFNERGLRIFGPTQKAARLEGSKVWAKEIMQRVGIPTASWRAFTDYESARSRAEELDWQCVIKADGLAAGKGSFVCESEQSVDEALEALERTRQTSSRVILVEELLQGQEVSVFALSDGNTVIPFGAAQDHKRLYDGDAGPNTGGMGAYSPVNHMRVAHGFADSFFQPLVHSLRALGNPYVGVLYAGAIVTDEGPKILEFNCRFGDPEAEVLLSRLDSDLGAYFWAATEGRLHTLPEPIWSPLESLCVVVAAAMYPDHGDFGTPIYGLEEAARAQGVLIFHAGTERDPETKQIATNGGRILAITATAEDLPTARDLAYDAIARIEFQGMRFRRDIGSKALTAAFDTEWRKAPHWETQMKVVSGELNAVATAVGRLQLTGLTLRDASNQLSSIRERLYALQLRAMSAGAETAGDEVIAWSRFLERAARSGQASEGTNDVQGLLREWEGQGAASFTVGTDTPLRFERHRTYDMLVWPTELDAREALGWLGKQRDSSTAFYADTSGYAYAFEPSDTNVEELVPESSDDFLSVRLEMPTCTALWSAADERLGDSRHSFAILAGQILLDDVIWFLRYTASEMAAEDFVGAFSDSSRRHHSAGAR